MADSVQTCLVDGVLEVEICRPEVANALDPFAARDLMRAVQEAAVDDGVVVVLLKGAGPRFCSGGDLKWVMRQEDPAAALRNLASELGAACLALDRLEKPVVCAVQGSVAGAGLAIMLAADYIIAEAETRFIYAYDAVGLSLDCGLSRSLPRSIGLHRALRFVYGREKLVAGQALEWGLVSEVVLGDALGSARQIATGLAAGRHRGVGVSRMLLRSSRDVDPDQVVSREARMISDLLLTAESMKLRHK